MLRHLVEIVEARWPDDDIDRHVEAEVAAAEPEEAPAPAAWWAADDWFYRDDYLATQLD